MRVVIGKKILEMSAEALEERLAPYEGLSLDIGTGDGKYVLRQAAAHPERFWIGLDSATDRMRDSSHRARRKASRGGLENVLFVSAAVEKLPIELAGRADQLCALYPWGSLLATLVKPESRVLEGLVATARPGAELTLLLNASVFDDEAYRQRLNLPPLNEARIAEVLRPAYKAAGIALTRWEYLGAQALHRSSWGQRLTLGSKRDSLLIEATVLGR